MAVFVSACFLVVVVISSPPSILFFVIPVPVLAQSLGLAVFYAEHTFFVCSAVLLLAVYPILFLWSALFDISHVVATSPLSLLLLWEADYA